MSPVLGKIKNIKFLFLTGYIFGSFYISKAIIQDTYEQIYELANTRKHNNTQCDNFATHAITTSWTFSLIPTILLLHPPYYAMKTIKEYLQHEDRV